MWLGELYINLNLDTNGIIHTCCIFEFCFKIPEFDNLYLDTNGIIHTCYNFLQIPEFDNLYLGMNGIIHTCYIFWFQIPEFDNLYLDTHVTFSVFRYQNLTIYTLIWMESSTHVLILMIIIHISVSH